MTHRALAWLVLVAAGCGDNLAVRDPDGAPPPVPVDAAVDAPVDAGVPPPPAVIVMIGDGMGMGQLAAASLYRHGEVGRLAMEQLPYRGQVRTASPSGITDSAAAATVMATGAFTYNGEIGLDRFFQPVETIVERAGRRGWSTGVVTTTSLPHATPAGFTAHVSSRGLMTTIADQQVLDVQPDVMLGGGTYYYAPRGDGSGRTDDGLYDDLLVAGYTLAFTRADLDAAVAAGAPRVFGAFAPFDLAYHKNRTPDTTEPALLDMARAALVTLDRDPHGFFLMIEGGRIDHAGHANHLIDTVQDTLQFDDTVAMVAAWARARGNVTLLVTADHECGGLEIVEARPAGQYPLVRWRWLDHTNGRVAVFGEGPGAERVDGAVIDHRSIYAIARGRVDRGVTVTPGPVRIPDGELFDLRHRVVGQRRATDFGAGRNQLDALWLDATADGLYIGLEGLFEWGHNAVEIWLDVDPGEGTGVYAPFGALTDATGVADRVLAASPLTEGPAELGADLALVSVGGADPTLTSFRDDGGLRGLHPPYGIPTSLGWLRATINYGDVRVRDLPGAPLLGQGLEAFVPWSMLYPWGIVPAGGRIRLAAMLVDSSGAVPSNQFLPPLPDDTVWPPAGPVPLPGVIEYELDHDYDGVIDGDLPPVVLP